MSEAPSPINNYSKPFLKMLGNVRDLKDIFFWFETLDDKGKESKLHKWVFRTFEQAADKLTALNSDGAGVFVCVNQTDGKARGKANVVGLRAWYVDIDLDKAQKKLSIEALFERLPLQPSMWIETPGGFHLYWLMHDAPIKCGEAGRQAFESDLKLVQAALSRYGADKACTDSNRLLRVPGFFHNKQQPQMMLFHDCGGKRYSREEFLRAFKSVPESSVQADLTAEPPSVEKPLDRRKVIQRVIKYLEKCPPAIQGQNGSKTCFETALKIQDGFDLTQNEALALMWEHYNPRCAPPWSEKELRHKIADAASKCGDRGYLLRGSSNAGAASANAEASPESSKASKESKASKASKDKRISLIVSWVLSQVELFHDGSSGFATTLNGTQSTYRLDSDFFEEWLVSKLYRDFHTLLKVYEKGDVLAVLKAKAKHDSPLKPVFTRIAQIDRDIYIDLCDPNWKQVRVSANGWGIVNASDSPVKFQRFPGMLALPVPARNGSIGLLRQFVNVDDNHFKLLIAWILQAFCGGKSFPVLIVNGVQGTGKTTACRAIRSLIDPSDVPDSGTPRNGPDALLAASRSWVQCWDNLSALSNDLSDLVCRIATGAGFRTRRLFSNSEENLLSVARPIIINGIPDLLRRDDLADRSVPIRLLAIENSRKTEREYWSAFECAKPLILGRLMDVLAGVLRELPNSVIRAEHKPRMLDFAHLGIATEKVCGWPDGCFLEAYEQSRAETANSVLEGSTVAQALISLAEITESGAVFSTSEIRKRLVEVAKRDGLNIFDKAFYNDRIFKGATERLNPALLRCYGFVLQWRRGKNRNEYRLHHESHSD